MLLSKLKTLPDANPQDLHWTIQQLVNRRDALVKATTASLNQLHTQLSHHYPSYRKFFSEVDSKTGLAFWEKYPAPYLLEHVTAEELAVLLRAHSHNACSTRKAEQILSLVGKDGDTKRAYQETRDFIVRETVKDVKFKKGQIAELEKELKRVVGLLDYKLETMPGIDTVTACALVANIGDINRFPNPDKPLGLQQAQEAARNLGKPFMLIADAYYAVGTSFIMAGECLSDQGQRLLHVLTRAKKNIVAYEPVVSKGGRGRPAIYGKKLHWSACLPRRNRRLPPL